jgi:hypothetical protein
LASQYSRENYAQPYNRPVVANIIARRDEATWFSYMQYLDGAMQERWAVGWSPSEYVTESKWNGDMALAENPEPGKIHHPCGAAIRQMPPEFCLLPTC